MADAHGPDVRVLLRDAARALGGDDGAGEAALLLAHVLGRDRAWLIAHDDAVPDADDRARFTALVDARARGEPVAYLLGRREFWSLPLAVSPAVLIPRPDTETLVDRALAILPHDVDADVLDLGTGSGAIALAIARERPLARVVATDVSPDALDIARANARSLSLDNVVFADGDWWHAIARDARFALVVSNPPYLRADDPHLVQGDLRFEPRGALVSGDDGLDAIRAIVAGAPAHLVDGGTLIVEHGYDQGEAVRVILAGGGFANVATTRDFGDNDRISEGTWRA